MVGGLLLSITASWDKAHPKATRWEKLEPQLFFNIGRIVGYAFFGGLTGYLGNQLVLSLQSTGMVKIVLSLLMIWLGLNILGLLPKKYCSMPLPRFIVKYFQKTSESKNVLMSFFLGGSTYFIPCGFTQSMQLLALTSGSFATGATIMTVFAFGTLPALLGIGILSSIADGKAGKLFITLAGAASLLLGIGNLQAGLSLTGIDISLPSFLSAPLVTSDPHVTIDENGQQIIRVGVSDKGYNVDSFTIDAGKTTWIYATADSLSGCLSTITVPAFDISSPLVKGENWIGPIQPSQDFAFMCSAGLYRANVRVRS
jgi:sulfite exporter TauE/SafE